MIRTTEIFGLAIFGFAILGLSILGFASAPVRSRPGWRRLGWLAVLAALLAGCATKPPPVTAPPQPASGTPERREPLKLGLALGGGAARGFAHVGVIQVLEEAGLRADMVAGTSAGSVVGALYASGHGAQQLQLLAQTMEEAALADWILPIFNRGVLRGEALARYVQAQTAGRPIERMSIPLGIVATDLRSGEGVLFRRGDTGTAVRASSAVPSVFQPVSIGGRDYVDGGLVSPVPVRYARQMGADVVLAVDIASAPESNPARDSLQILLQTFTIMGRSISDWELRDADVVVRPAMVDVSSTDFAARRRAIEAGRQAMQAALPALRNALAAKAAGRLSH